MSPNGCMTTLCVLVAIHVSSGACIAKDDVYEEIGDYMLGGLFPVHVVDCEIYREIEVIHRVEAMAYAIRSINARSDILLNVTLGFTMYDTCSYEPVALERATQFLPGVLGGYSSKIREPVRDISKPVIGIIGTERSTTAEAVALLFGVYEIPMVSFFTTSEDLDDEGRYPYFLRVVPSDKYQVEAILDILEHFNWTYVSVIYTGDSYGRDAINNMRTDILQNKRSVCLGTEFEINEDTANKKLLEFVIYTILKESNFSKVVILFTQIEHANVVLEVMKKAGALGKLQLIGTDGWASSIGEIDMNNREMATGTVKTQLPDEEDFGFEDYFNGLMNMTFNEICQKSANPWLSHFLMTYKNDCIADGCEYHLTRGYSESSGVSRVTAAVNAYAAALDEIIREYCNTTFDVEPPCDLKGMVVRAPDIVKRMRQTDIGSLWSDSLKKYEIEVIRYNESVWRQYELSRVGVWDNKKLIFTESNIPWAVTNGGPYDPPISVCNPPCDKGFQSIPVGNDAGCCFKCTQCPDRYVVVDGTDCLLCGDKEEPDEAIETCVPVAPIYIRWSDAPAVILALIASIGVVTVGLVFFGYVRRNQHPLIKASSRELSYLMLMGVLSSFALVFSFFGKPSAVKCYVIRHGFMLCFTVIYAPLLTRANRIYRIFRAGKKSAKRPRLISPKSQIAIASLFIFVQFMINVAWQINYKPNTMEHIHSPGVVEITCNNRVEELLVSLCYNIVLVLLCSVHAFMTRKVPTNYNESHFISLSVYTTIVIWLAFIPCYFLIPGIGVKLIVMSIALIFSGSITLAFMFVPKLYAVEFVSDVNVNAAGTYREQGSTTEHQTKSDAAKPKNIHAVRVRSLLRVGAAVAPAAIGDEDNQPSEIDTRSTNAQWEDSRISNFHSLAVEDHHTTITDTFSDG